MEVTIGIRNASRELTFTIEQDGDYVTSKLSEALKLAEPLVLTDTSGRTYAVPVAGIGYVLTGTPEPRRVGFVV